MLDTKDLVDMREQYQLADGRIALVVRFADAHMVLVGRKLDSVRYWEMYGPYRTHTEAFVAARRLTESVAC
jgi:hypothetical protein